MKTKVLFLIVVILFGIISFSNYISSGAYMGGVYEIDTVAYLPSGAGIIIANVSEPNSPIVMSFFNIGNYAKIWDIYVIDTFAYVADNYAGLRIINVSDPLLPIESGRCDIGNERIWGIYVIDTFVYIAADDEGLRIINVSDPTTPIQKGYYDMGGSAYGVYVVDTFAYVPYGAAGLKIINVSDPTAPTGISVYNTDGYTRDVYIVDTFAYIADGSAGLRIINISNPTAPVEIGYYDTYVLVAVGVSVVDTFAYVVDNYVELRIINVSDPTAPIEMDFYNGNFTWCLYATDTSEYVSVDSSGLSIINYPISSSRIEDNKLPDKVYKNNYYIRYNIETIDIYFGLSEKGELILDIYDNANKKIRTLNYCTVESGYTKISINKKKYPTGEYFIKGKMGDTKVSAKIIIKK